METNNNDSAKKLQRDPSLDESKLLSLEYLGERDLAFLQLVLTGYKKDGLSLVRKIEQCHQTSNLPSMLDNINILRSISQTLGAHTVIGYLDELEKESTHQNKTQFTIVIETLYTEFRKIKQYADAYLQRRLDTQ